MIEFTCDACGRAYSVPDATAGKKAKCKCGAALVVPGPRAIAAPFVPEPVGSPVVTAEVPANPPPTGVGGTETTPDRPASPGPVPSLAPRKLPMRTRRLMADAAAMAKAFGNFDLIRLKATTGAPPEVYQIEYFVHGLERGKKREPVVREQHVVEIQLTSDYPRLGPKCRMLTPVFHPNIDPTTICVGDHWTAGERLSDLVVRIGEMIAFQDYNIKSPLDGEAAMWADLNGSKLPIDTRNLQPPVSED